MTFKHGKFEDSVTMRSFLKVAEQKGWVKPEPLHKKASAALDLSPTHSLTENVLKLCAGLRQAGMNKYADEVETNFFNYKRANDLYDVHNEEGKDLVDAAHPDGSHKMEDLEGDATIETILDQHLKDMEVVEKKPVGKLTDASSILKAVKLVLAQDLESLQNKLNSLMATIRSAANSIATATEADLTVSWSTFAEGIGSLTQQPTIANLEQIKKIISQQRMRLKPGGIIFSGISEEAWTHVEPRLNLITNSASQAIEIIKQRELLKEQVEEKEQATPAQKPITLAPVEITSGPLDNLFRQINSLKNKLNSWTAIGTIAKNPAAKKWIQDEINALNDISTRYGKVPEDQEENMAAQMQAEIAKEVTDINAFQKSWVG